METGPVSLVSIGAESAPPAHSTPGSDAMRSITSWKNRAWRRGSGYLEGGSITKAVRRFFGLNPRSTCCTRTKLRTNRPAPASSISASAISATTSTLRALPRVEPIVNRLPQCRFPMPHGATGVRKIRDVAADDQQHNADRTHKDQQRRTNLAPHWSSPTDNLHTQLAILGVLLGQSIIDGIHLGLSLRQCDAGL